MSSDKLYQVIETGELIIWQDSHLPRWYKVADNLLLMSVYEVQELVLTGHKESWLTLFKKLNVELISIYSLDHRSC